MKLRIETSIYVGDMLARVFRTSAQENLFSFVFLFFESLLVKL